MAKLFTVVITKCDGHYVPTGHRISWFEADFEGIHFSRTNESDVIHWVRVAAKRIHGKDTQVIFLHTEG